MGSNPATPTTHTILTFLSSFTRVGPKKGTPEIHERTLRHSDRHRAQARPGDVRRARADNARLLKAFPEFFALDATHHPHMTMIQQFVRTAELAKVYAAASAVLAKEAGDGLEAQGDPVLLHSLSAARHRRDRGRADGSLAPAAAGTPRRGRAFHREDGNPGGVFQQKTGATFSRGLSTTSPISSRSPPAKSSIRMSRSASRLRPISTRCSPSRSSRSRSRR